MESFYTLQGEGFHQGRAAYFIRLGGCDVGCVWCDVKDSWDATKHPKYSVEEIVEKMEKELGIRNRELGSNLQPLTSNLKPIVVITGGEPLMHNLDALTKAIHTAGYQTNIETSGSSPLSGEWDWICLSPKKFKAPLPEVVPHASELKVVIFNKSDFAWAETYAAQVSSNCKLYLQPEWDKAAQVTPLIIDYIKANPQWELSLQVHKYINVP
ncbi:7-carboxy-7-deazaguanine synthase QueE [Lacibacter luteus]|uniref:7-carboxy-7-deazaguanine synthase n=2 Tax=Lacibacter luteus TaxID=2508719 RepID=A0A4Q1CP16_9BACT|nr:7-carboxy-7-deazaguanine synthase QueE [Lacibacter luteus]